MHRLNPHFVAEKIRPELARLENAAGQSANLHHPCCWHSVPLPPSAYCAGRDAQGAGNRRRPSCRSDGLLRCVRCFRHALISCFLGPVIIGPPSIFWYCIKLRLSPMWRLGALCCLLWRAVVFCSSGLFRLFWSVSMSSTPSIVESKAFSLVPTNLAEAEKIAALIAKSDLVPKDYRNQPQNVFVAIQWGQEVGLKPMQSMQNIAVINGRPSIYGDAALALVMSHPDFEDIEEKIEGAGDDRAAVCTLKRKGRSPTVRRFSVAMAKAAKLWGKEGPWTSYPERMLQMRARGFALRDSYPDALKGLNLAEESQDVELEINPPARPAIVTPQAAAPAKPEPAIIEGTVVVVTAADVEAAIDAATPAADPSVLGVAASANQLKVLRTRIASAGLTDADLCDQFFILKLEDLPASAVPAASKWVKENGKAAQ